jgi:hypothetical protein
MLVGLDPEMNITLINRKSEKASGVIMEEAVGAPLNIVLEDFAPAIKNMQSAIKIKPFHSDFFKNKNLL